MSGNDAKRFRLLTTLDVRFKLGSELFDDGLYRPTSAVSQSANRCAGHDANAVADFSQDVEVFELPATLANAVGNLEHPPCAFSRWCALATRFMRKETRHVP